MAFLLGRDALIGILAGDPDHPAARWSRLVDNAELFVSVITLGEIEAAAQDLPPEKATSRQHYLHLLDVHVPRVFGNRILEVTLSLAREWGRVMQQARALGFHLSAEEGMEIATARQEGYTYLTTPAPHHGPLGVQVLQPTPP